MKIGPTIDIYALFAQKPSIRGDEASWQPSKASIINVLITSIHVFLPLGL